MRIENMSQARRVLARVYRGQDVDIYRKKGVVHVRVGAHQLPPAELGELTESSLLQFVAEHLGSA